MIAIRESGGEPAATERHQDAREVGEVLEQLEPDRTLTCDDRRIVERVAEHHPRLVGVCPGRGDRLGDARTALVDDGAVALARGDLRDRGSTRHEDLAGHTVTGGCDRQRLGMVASAPGRDAPSCRIAECLQLVRSRHAP